ncbi:hypothetical protein AC578_10353 [Pseudocercospora eumusae]|uniref:Uncharacterized protein n=1 Tax=Pseudocercospora eumusae TaxID=321146 RepID=A0A139HRF8_9PEZI|nr:hypothetical protein AC578_10353 [Pseudocercospora eumusae]
MERDRQGKSRAGRRPQPAKSNEVEAGRCDGRFGEVYRGRDVHVVAASRLPEPVAVIEAYVASHRFAIFFAKLTIDQEQRRARTVIGGEFEGVPLGDQAVPCKIRIDFVAHLHEAEWLFFSPGFKSKSDDGAELDEVDVKAKVMK